MHMQECKQKFAGRGKEVPGLCLATCIAMSYILQSHQFVNYYNTKRHYTFKAWYYILFKIFSMNNVQVRFSACKLEYHSQLVRHSVAYVLKNLYEPRH
jgi:hypothetical protein